MDRGMLRAQLKDAAEILAEKRALIDRQRNEIAQLQLNGQDTTAARAALENIELASPFICSTEKALHAHWRSSASLSPSERPPAPTTERREIAVTNLPPSSEIDI
jgi:hypothetical protein